MEKAQSTLFAVTISVRSDRTKKRLPLRTGQPHYSLITYSPFTGVSRLMILAFYDIFIIALAFSFALGGGASASAAGLLVSGLTNGL
jgi:hypothetical protein